MKAIQQVLIDDAQLHYYYYDTMVDGHISGPPLAKGSLCRPLRADEASP